MNYKEVLRLKYQILSNSEESELNDKIKMTVHSMNHLSFNEKVGLIQDLQNEIVGYGVIQSYLDNPGVSELMINGLDSFYIEINGCIQKLPVIYESEDHLMQLIYRIASEVGREINQSKPILDARLKDGSRVNVILNPVAINGPIVTIRKFNKSINTGGRLTENDTLTPELEQFLVRLVRSKHNIFISGGTSTGKTTILNYISQNIPSDERIITIEDAAEIDIQNKGHIISMETRNSSTKENEITISKLIKNSLRMRPDRIIVGEVRGEEVVDMLQAMNTGHDGSISTGHANSAMDMLVRLEVIASSHSDIGNTLIRKQIISAIDIIIHLERLNGRRYIEYVYEMDKSKSEYTLNQIYDREQDRDTTEKEFEKRLRYRRKLDKYFKRQDEIIS